MLKLLNSKLIGIIFILNVHIKKKHCKNLPTYNWLTIAGVLTKSIIYFFTMDRMCNELTSILKFVKNPFLT